MDRARRTAEKSSAPDPASSVSVISYSMLNHTSSLSRIKFGQGKSTSSGGYTTVIPQSSVVYRKSNAISLLDPDIEKSVVRESIADTGTLLPVASQVTEF